MALFCGAMTMLAQQKSLFITFNDGSKTEFAMSDNPAITMADGTMTVVGSSSQIGYELWRVKQITFGNSTAIREIRSNSILLDGSNAKIYTLDGKAVHAAINNGEIDLNGLATGIYIININGKTIKYMKP
jgi:hypothetical protein